MDNGSMSGVIHAQRHSSLCNRPGVRQSDELMVTTAEPPANKTTTAAAGRNFKNRTPVLSQSNTLPPLLCTPTWAAHTATGSRPFRYSLTALTRNLTRCVPVLSPSSSSTKETSGLIPCERGINLTETTSVPQCSPARDLNPLQQQERTR